MNIMKSTISTLLLLAVVSLPALSQNPPAKVTDSNTALHALPPDYPVPYKAIKAEEVTEVLNRIYAYLEASSPAKLVDRQTKAQCFLPGKLPVTISSPITPLKG
jgi:unsaturated rhamnogalacturonyl hydrolase